LYKINYYFGHIEELTMSDQHNTNNNQNTNLHRKISKQKDSANIAMQTVFIYIYVQE